MTICISFVIGQFMSHVHFLIELIYFFNLFVKTFYIFWIFIFYLQYMLQIFPLNLLFFICLCLQRFLIFFSHICRSFHLHFEFCVLLMKIIHFYPNIIGNRHSHIFSSRTFIILFFSLHLDL